MKKTFMFGRIFMFLNLITVTCKMKTMQKNASNWKILLTYLGKIVEVFSIERKKRRVFLVELFIWQRNSGNSYRFFYSSSSIVIECHQKYVDCVRTIRSKVQDALYLWEILLLLFLCVYFFNLKFYPS